MKFMLIVCAAFLARQRPVATSAKPACINITRKAASSVHTKLSGAPAVAPDGDNTVPGNGGISAQAADVAKATRVTAVEKRMVVLNARKEERRMGGKIMKAIAAGNERAAPLAGHIP